MTKLEELRAALDDAHAVCDAAEDATDAADAARAAAWDAADAANTAYWDAWCADYQAELDKQKELSNDKN